MSTNNLRVVLHLNCRCFFAFEMSVTSPLERGWGNGKEDGEKGLFDQGSVERKKKNLGTMLDFLTFFSSKTTEFHLLLPKQNSTPSYARGQQSSARPGMGERR